MYRLLAEITVSELEIRPRHTKIFTDTRMYVGTTH